MRFPRWHGFRVVAADASKLQLFLKDATGRKVREAIAFMMYLPGSEMALDFELYAPAVSERQMLFEHLDSLRRNDLLVLDPPISSEGLYLTLSHNSACNEPWLRGQLARKMTELVAAGLPEQLLQHNLELWKAQQMQPDPVGDVNQ